MAKLERLVVKNFVLADVPLDQVQDIVINELEQGNGVMERLAVFERIGGVSVWQDGEYMCSYGIILYKGFKGTLWFLPGKRLETANPVALFRVIREAIKALTNETGMKEVTAHIWEPNAKGRRLVELLGMEYQYKNDNNYLVYKRAV